MRPDDYQPNQPVKHKAFAKRMQDTCDDSPFIPPLNKGRLVWLQEHLEKDYRIEVTRETVRKWMNGETIPRNEKLRALAALLKVDEGWLAFGIQTEEGVASKVAARTVSENPAATIVAGFIQLAGGMCALPDADDPNDFVDLYCIVRARQHRVSCALAEMTGTDTFRTYVTNQYRHCTVAVVLPTGDMKVDIFVLPSEVIEKHGITRGPNIEIQAKLVDRHWTVGGVVINRVRDLRREMA